MDGSCSSDSLKGMLLQYAQELGLKCERQFANLIQKDRSAISGLELSPFLGDGSSE